MQKVFEPATIFFDMDGTLFDLYGVPDWLPRLRAEDASPYIEAAPLLNLQNLGETLQTLQNNGVRIGVISWLSKDATATYKKAIRRAKKKPLPPSPANLMKFILCNMEHQKGSLQRMAGIIFLMMMQKSVHNGKEKKIV